MKATIYGFLTGSIIIVIIIFLVNNYINDQGEIDNSMGLIQQEIEEIISTKQPKLDPIIVTKISSTIEKYSEEYKIPQELIIAIIEIESSFRPTVTSSQNCIGLMQINPKAHPEKIKDMSIYEVYHIDNNIRIGCQIFNEYYKAARSIDGALSKYYGANNKEYINKTLTSFTDMIMNKKAQTSENTETVKMDEDV